MNYFYYFSAAYNISCTDRVCVCVCARARARVRCLEGTSVQKSLQNDVSETNFVIDTLTNTMLWQNRGVS